MLFINRLHSLRAFFLALCLAMWLAPAFARADDETEEIDTQELYSGFEQTATSATRSPKPLSQTAENVTVITTREIERLNAHTLADVLATIPGVQTENRGGPGNRVAIYLQSTGYNHTLVVIDGVPLNDLADNYADVTTIPAQIIERIEILKGAASSSWGQALGGVVSVTTKAPERDRTLAGTVSASIGSRTTADTRAELSGTRGRLGYYLSGGYLGNNGVLTGRPDYGNNLHAKLVYDLPSEGSLWSTFAYSNASRGSVHVPANLGGDLHEDQKTRNLRLSLGFNRPLAENLHLELLARHNYRYLRNIESVISDSTLLWKDRLKNNVTGGSAKLTWQERNNLLVVGGEFEHAEYKKTDLLQSFVTDNKKSDRWGFFLNDTLTLGRVAVTPGIRYDNTDTPGGGQVSPSLGVTWQVTDATLLRAYTGRGYSLPSITPANYPAEKIWSSQLGFETQAVPYLWLKGTLFRNEVWQISPNSDSGPRHIALGSELELRTVPVFHTFLGAGWTYTDTYRTNDGTPVWAAPTHTVQLSLNYDDSTYRGTLTGRHIYWNGNPAYNGRYTGMIWDLHLGATLYEREHNSLELFFSGRNLFNGRQYSDEWIPNIGRWFEGGMRVRF